MIKAVIISQQGSGTNLLRSFLNSHPDVFIWDEIFTRTDRYKAMVVSYGENSVNKYLEELFRTGRNFDKMVMGKIEPGEIPKVLGFDLKYNNIASNGLIWDWLVANKKDIKIIHLRRCKGRTFLRMTNEKKGSLYWKEFHKHIDAIGKWEKVIENEFGDFDYQSFNYEDMTRGYEISELPIDFEKRLLDFLGVKIMRLTISLDAVRPDKLKMRY